MKKNKLLKIITMTCLFMFLTSSSINNKVKADDNTVAPLLKFGTNTSILLHGKPIYIPKEVVHEKRQFRSAWISTVSNLDFPSKPGLTQEQFKAEYKKVLDNFQALNLNAVTFQVRPKADAFYKSNINPWSEWLTGVQGKDPLWDPMKWMIDETHKRNMEFHAWFNPYRVTVGYEPKKTKEQLLSTLSKNNWARKNPQYVLKFDGKLLLNPGEPTVRNYIKDSIMEVVQNYDIDAVHFDDYFYPYKVSRGGVTYTFGNSNEDLATFKKYGAKFTDIKAWRRNNIDLLIQQVSVAIKAKKPYVKFGVSPFGIWGHLDNHPAESIKGEGSHTPKASSSSYDDIYADTRSWVKNGWIDYITPQIYWSFGQNAAPYGELADWWANVVKGTNCQLYIGHANYKHISNSSWETDWKNPQEIPNQLRFNSMYPEVKGSCFFSLNSLKGNKLGETTIIKNQYFNYKSLVPTMPWLDNKAPEPIKISNINAMKNGINIKWNDKKQNDSTYYVIYRFNGDKIGDIENPANILSTVRRGSGQLALEFTDLSADINTNYTYAITAADRLHNESKCDSYIYMPNKN
ncbi:glycoside hydrolase family 10 protein [Clostridium lundense]|uniref:glycoside hydrolase family 10 protein n=1 Tax=Clostridium lundense TaxID=319475 RepID=UPI00068432D1|nr:family 10 glycosylhydrolase [Clostridium lundense]